MVSHHHATFGGHRHCGSGDIMFVVVEEQDSTYPRLDPPLLVRVSNERLPILVTHVHKKN